MELSSQSPEETESLRNILLAIARERSVDGLMVELAERLAQRPDFPLVRIYVLDDADICDSGCPSREQCPTPNTRCLQLRAAAGRAALAPSSMPNRAATAPSCPRPLTPSSPRAAPPPRPCAGEPCAN